MAYFNELTTTAQALAEPQQAQRRVVVLAGGQGTRMRPLIRLWLGENRPKQYCAFSGRRTMIQHTLDRALELVEPAHIQTVITDGHRPWLSEAVPNLPGEVIEQPHDCGTAAGLIAALAVLLHEDPQATVLVMPADQFVYPEHRLVRYASQACMLAESFDKHLILLGATASCAETDYGWIVPHEKVLSSLHGVFRREPMSVRAFQEKPNPIEAERLLREGALWNTMVMAAKARTLWNLCRRLLPEMTGRFEAYRQAVHAARSHQVDPAHERIALTHIYQQLERADFTSDILARAVDSLIVLPMDDVEWCDWGRPERVRETLGRFGLRHNNELNYSLRMMEETATLQFSA